MGTIMDHRSKAGWLMETVDTTITIRDVQGPGQLINGCNAGLRLDQIDNSDGP